MSVKNSLARIEAAEAWLTTANGVDCLRAERERRVKRRAFDQKRRLISAGVLLNDRKTPQLVAG